METIELLPHLRFREVQKILDELLRQRLIDPVMYDMVLRKYSKWQKYYASQRPNRDIQDTRYGAYGCVHTAV